MLHWQNISTNGLWGIERHMGGEGVLDEKMSQEVSQMIPGDIIGNIWVQDVMLNRLNSAT